MPALTTIQDTLYKADGTPMNGDVIITWPPFVAADGSKIAAQTLTVPVSSGYFQVALVPTVGANTAVAYSVRINSAGQNESTELWSVPQTSTPLTIASVMIGQTGGVIIGSGQRTDAARGDTSIQITDVVGLNNQLVMRPMIGPAFADSRAAIINSTGGIDAAAGNLSDCLHVDGSSGAADRSAGRQFRGWRGARRNGERIERAVYSCCGAGFFVSCVGMAQRLVPACGRRFHGVRECGSRLSETRSRQVAI